MESLTNVVLLSNGQIAPLTKNECQETVKKCLGSDNFEIDRITIGRRSKDLIGFMGEHWKINISVKIEGNTDRDLKFFAKTIPVNLLEHAEFVTSCGAYEKETKLYLTVLEDFQKYYDKECELEETEVSSFRSGSGVTCECYFVRPNLIVLEDLSVLGFKCLNARIPMDLEHCVAVLQTMARFHAASILYEEERGKQCRINEVHPELFFETLFTDKDGPMRSWLLTGVRSTLAVADLVGKYGSDTEDAREFHRKMKETFHETWDWVKPSKKYRNVVCHGDLWSSNIQFRYVGSHVTPVEVRFVDFQLARYLPPAHDVVSFLHLTTTKQFRERHLETLLDVYYDALNDVLLGRGVVLERFLTRAQFVESCDVYKCSSVLMCSSYFPAIIDEKAVNLFESSETFNNYATVDRTKRVVDGFTNDPVIRSRMTDIVEDLIEVLLEQ